MGYTGRAGPKGGFVSTNNSTTSALVGAAVFTGKGEDVSGFSSISLSWNSDVAAASNGCSMQFSTDNTNWDTRIDFDSHSDTVHQNHGGYHRESVFAQYFRIVYTNGSGAQSFFRLQTLFHSDNSLPLVCRIEQQINTTSDVALTRSATDISLDLARRQITGQRKFFLFGFNNDIDTAVWEDIHPNGGDINWITTASKVAISSSHAADTAAGLGCRSVEIHGLSATGADQDEVIPTDGLTEVESALTYCRLNLQHNETVGTYGGSHQGDITCRVTSGGAKTGLILSVMTGFEGSVGSTVQYGSGEAGNGFTSIPLGKVAYLTGGSVFIGTVGDKTADVSLYEREGILNVTAPFDSRRVLWDSKQVKGDVPIVFNSHKKIKALTDLFFRAQASDDDTKVSVFLEYYLVDANAAGE